MTATALTPAQLAHGLRIFTEGAFELDEAARARLTKALASGEHISSFLLEGVVEKQADAANWRQLINRLDKGEDVIEAVTTIRRMLTKKLLEYGESTSTSAIANDMNRQEREAARRFLDRTGGLI
ncbi:MULTISPECIES: hypothetical protein [unclassified Streptomyces]|uniref:hypothetical protein n=1 Tax=unclassified Streptomyces TaxID=2593676 RepID=UPI00037F8695|nr:MULTISPECIES: hypothetical protein [unclassified Streptomyces]MYX39009.1 hypothetical protein [Streptomyces sp. SID8377]